MQRFEKEKKYRIRHHGDFGYRRYAEYLLLNDGFTEEIITWFGTYINKIRPRQVLYMLLHNSIEPKNLMHGIEQCYDIFGATIEDLKSVLSNSSIFNKRYYSPNCLINLDVSVLPNHWLIWICRKIIPPKQNPIYIFDSLTPYIYNIDEYYITKELDNYYISSSWRFKLYKKSILYMAVWYDIYKNSNYIKHQSHALVSSMIAKKKVDLKFKHMFNKKKMV